MARIISEEVQNQIETLADRAFLDELSRTGRGFIVFRGESYYDPETLRRSIVNLWENDDSFWDTWAEGGFSLSPIVPITE